MYNSFCTIVNIGRSSWISPSHTLSAWMTAGSLRSRIRKAWQQGLPRSPDASEMTSSAVLSWTLAPAPHLPAPVTTPLRPPIGLLLGRILLVFSFIRLALYMDGIRANVVGRVLGHLRCVYVVSASTYPLPSTGLSCSPYSSVDLDTTLSVNDTAALHFSL